MFGLLLRHASDRPTRLCHRQARRRARGRHRSGAEGATGGKRWSAGVMKVFASNATAMWTAGLAVLPIGPDRQPSVADSIDGGSGRDKRQWLAGYVIFRTTTLPSFQDCPEWWWSTVTMRSRMTRSRSCLGPPPFGSCLVEDAIDTIRHPSSGCPETCVLSAWTWTSRRAGAWLSLLRAATRAAISINSKVTGRT